MNQAIERETNATAIVTRSGISGRRLAKLALVVLAALAVATAVIPSVTRNTNEANAVPSEGQVGAEHADATARIGVEAERWTALAAAYETHGILTPGRLAEVARWDAVANRYARPQTAEAARWNGLADHHQTHSPALQAWADRYQRLAEASE